ncbi:MAG: cupin domain-containing protein [Acidobacteriota bacterium]|nr:cupin domain-containing protein [Acidobacteriota bacterium]
MYQPIQIGRASVLFLKSRHDTDGAMDLFEMTLQPRCEQRVPHFHRDYDETVLGIDGTVHWCVNGKAEQLQPGQQLLIPRGTPHSYSNPYPSTARMLCIYTPGLVGPEYFRELAQVFAAGGPPDIAAVASVMSRYGMIPAATRRPAVARATMQHHSLAELALPGHQ